MAGPYTAFTFGDPQENLAYFGSGGFNGPVFPSSATSNPVPIGQILQTAFIGTAYSETITAAGGTGPYTYAVTVGTLPTSLSLSSGGVISGTPTVAGTYSFTITVTDSATLTGTTAFQIIVKDPPVSNFAYFG